jgi:hypothetical protein
MATIDKFARKVIFLLGYLPVSKSGGVSKPGANFISTVNAAGQ